MRRQDARGRRPQLSLLPGGACPGTAPGVEASDAGEDALRLAVEIVQLLAAAPDGDSTHAPLALPLALSACMARHGLDPEDLIDAMLPLRRALITVSALDAAREPVPLTAGEPKEAALSLAGYLHGLLARASVASDVHREALASAAADQLHSA